MRYIKMFFTGILGLTLLATVMGLLMPSSVKISRGVIIDADSARVAEGLLKSDDWQKWMPWMHHSEGVVTRQEGEKGRAGFVFQWKSVDGKQDGTIQYKGYQPGFFHFTYAFKEMNQSEGGFRIRSIENGKTELQWVMEYPLKWYPWERFYGIFIDSLIGAVLETGLQEFTKYISSFSKENV